jgi:hypothetical protein
MESMPKDEIYKRWAPIVSILRLASVEGLKPSAALQVAAIAIVYLPVDQTAIPFPCPVRTAVGRWHSSSNYS